jgi:hypothetical protein
VGRPRARLPLLVLLLELAARPAWPWGCDGHEVVASVASRHLGPPAAHQVAALIGQPSAVTFVSRRCNVTGLEPLANVSTWADDIRSVVPTTGPWHFLDIPRGTSASDPVTEFCPPAGCVTRAITEQLHVLEDASRTTQERANALMYVVHFVGDVHQPLHSTTNRDRGGNCVPVDFFGQRSRPDPQSSHGDWRPNLHSVWDTDLVRTAMAGATVQQYAQALDARFAGRFASWQHGTPATWAKESNRIANEIVYGKLPVPLPVESGDVARCDEDHISDHWRSYHEQLDQTYADAAIPVVEEQLAKAGARLAMVLNDVWH